MSQHLHRSRDDTSLLDRPRKSIPVVGCDEGAREVAVRKYPLRIRAAVWIVAAVVAWLIPGLVILSL